MPRTQEGLARLLEREGIVAPRIVEAFRKVPREDFVPQDTRSSAYRDRPIGLPERQTTSQPSLIARMLDAAAPQPTDRALEVGTGYGFQTALLGQLVDKVISVERWPALAESARANLARAGITNVDMRVGDGWQGAKDAAPFDVIIVSAAAEKLPAALADQLAEGGRLVIPLTSRGSDDVWLLTKRNGELQRVRLVSPARFVPLVRGVPE